MDSLSAVINCLKLIFLVLIMVIFILTPIWLPAWLSAWRSIPPRLTDFLSRWARRNL